MAHCMSISDVLHKALRIPLMAISVLSVHRSLFNTLINMYQE